MFGCILREDLDVQAGALWDTCLWALAREGKVGKGSVGDSHPTIWSVKAPEWLIPAVIQVYGHTKTIYLEFSKETWFHVRIL